MKKSVDYIFYSAGSLVPAGVLKTIDYRVIDATNGLPTRDFPSDHLSLKAVMAFNK
jgi:mRNA deadenylase 3'-5' endonuclease subunit Ccr4